MDSGGAGITALGTIPATVPAAARARDTMPGQARPQQGQAPAAASGRHAAVPADVTGDDDDDDEVLPRRRRWPVMTSILALFVLLIGGGLFFGHQYLNSQYYVGTTGGQVAIFRGLDQQLFGISLSSVYQKTDIPVAGIPSQDVQAIRQDSAGSLAQASTLVTNIRKSYQACQAAYAAVRRWEAGKPKPVRVRIKEANGKIVVKLVTPKYRPKPTVPADCPAQPASGT